ncbi:MAG: hypothetical protein JXR13_18695 [Thalassovita sp.]
MTLDEAMDKIEKADPDKAYEVAQECILQLSDEDRLVAGQDLVNTALLRDLMTPR